MATKGSLVVGKVLLVLALELLHKVVHQSVVEVLTTKMGVARGVDALEERVDLDRGLGR